VCAAQLCGGVRQRIDAVLDYATAKDIRDAQNAVFPREAIEAARAHRLKDKAEATYARARPLQQAASVDGRLVELRRSQGVASSGFPAHGH
jgi:hypothetical protein